MERPAKYPQLATLIACAIAIGGLYLAKTVLIPLALALVLTFLLAPLVTRLQRWHLNRVVAIAAAVLLVCVVTTAVGWLVTGELRDLATRLPDYRHSIQDKVATIRAVIEGPFTEATKTVQDLGSDLATSSRAGAASEPVQTVRIAPPPSDTLGLALGAVGPTLDAILTAAVAMLLAFVILLGREDLRDRVIRVVGHGEVLVTTQALDEAATKVSSYISRLLILNGLHGTAVGLGLLAIGVPNALVWGLLSAIFRFVPYVGPWIAASLPILTALAVFDGWLQPLLTVGFFVLLELVSNNVVEPWLFSSGTGVSALAVLVSTLFWTWIWGPVGLVLATPLTVCIVVMSKYVRDLNFLYLLFGDAPALPPPARFYQRLLAGDQDQAWSVLQSRLQEQPLAGVYDTVVLPALSMAERDRQKGALDTTTDLQIAETAKLLLEEARDAAAVKSGEVARPTVAGSRELRVLCIPAHGSADALAATMLRQVLELDGIHADVASLDALLSETLKSLESQPVDVVCISTVPPTGFIRVRHLCKRIARQYPELAIVIGIWSLDRESPEAADSLPIPTGVHSVRLLGDACLLLRSLAEKARSRRDAGSGDGTHAATSRA